MSDIYKNCQSFKFVLCFRSYNMLLIVFICSKVRFDKVINKISQSYHITVYKQNKPFGRLPAQWLQKPEYSF